MAGSSLAAQQTPPPRPPVDTVRAGTVRADTVRADTVRADSAATRPRTLTDADTIKTPLAAAPVPVAISARNGATHWNRDELFAAGALTLGELLANVPGVTLMTSGFMLAPSVVAWHGDPGGVRVFVDGVEREEVTIRSAGVTDFSLIPLWSLEDVSLEETAGELRVHVRTWTVDRTTAATRTDVLTGSENLNLFRGYFGKRAANGAVLQLAAQQLSTTSIPGMDGEALGTMARIGWAAGSWSVDATTIRQGIQRTVGARFLLTGSPDGNALPAFTGSTSMSYVRVGWKAVDREGAWVQLVAATLSSKLRQPEGSTGIAADSGDTTASQGQYTAQAGLNRGALRMTVGARARAMDGSTATAPFGRAEWHGLKYALSGSAGKRFAATTVWDVRAQATPFSWLRLSATTGAFQPSGDTVSRSGTSADALLTLRGRWIGGGLRTVGAAIVLPPVVFDKAMEPITTPAATAHTFTAGAPIWRGWMARTDVVAWTSATPYRPQTQARTRLWFASDFRERFPRSNFHLLAVLNHEYRSRLFVPKEADPFGQVAKAFGVFGTLLEIRIGTAVISWDYRNTSGLNYETFPGYVMPRIASVYGIRWQFWN